MTKRTILFLAANPHVTHEGGLGLQVQRGALDHEASAIHKELKGSGYRDRFELVTRWAAEPHDQLAAVVPDGTRVVTASFDQTARVWDAATGKPLGSPLVHQGQVRSAAFSPDGTRVVTASHDQTARVWETALDRTLPKDWPALAARSLFVLVNGVHVHRSSLTSSVGAPR